MFCVAKLNVFIVHLFIRNINVKAPNPLQKETQSQLLAPAGVACGNRARTAACEAVTVRGDSRRVYANDVRGVRSKKGVGVESLHRTKGLSIQSDLQLR